MLLHLNLFRTKDPLYHTFLIYNKSGAECTHILASVHRLFAPHAKSLVEFHVGIGNQREGQVVFGLSLIHI